MDTFLIKRATWSREALSITMFTTLNNFDKSLHSGASSPLESFLSLPCFAWALKKIAFEETAIYKHSFYASVCLFNSVCLHAREAPSVANLSSVVRNYNAKLTLFQLTFLTATENSSSTSSSSSKILKIASKSSPHTNRSSTPSAILNELVHGQSHLTGLFNIADRAIV